jgi:enoyl-CoA hydratase
MITQQYETLQLTSPQPDLLLVVLDRPSSRNALNSQMGRDLFDLFEAIASDHNEIRCIVVTGQGDKAFCSGGDLKERLTMDAPQWRLQHLIFERMVRALIDCPIPLIAAVNGSAYGGGCEIAACCDFIYASESAVFALSEVKLGIIPGGGGTQTVTRAVGERRAKEMILTGRPISARDALEWGLVNRVIQQSELLDEALTAASMIARNAPMAVRQAKQSIHRGLQMALRDGLAFEIEAYNRTVDTEDRRRGITAALDKQPPVFQGR